MVLFVCENFACRRKTHDIDPPQDLIEHIDPKYTADCVSASGNAKKIMRSAYIMKYITESRVRMRRIGLPPYPNLRFCHPLNKLRHKSILSVTMAGVQPYAILWSPGGSPSAQMYTPDAGLLISAQLM